MNANLNDALQLAKCFTPSMIFIYLISDTHFGWLGPGSTQQINPWYIVVLHPLGSRYPFPPSKFYKGGPVQENLNSSVRGSHSGPCHSWKDHAYCLCGQLFNRT